MEIICLNNYKAKYSHTGNLSLIRFFIPVVIYVIKYFEVEVEVELLIMSLMIYRPRQTQ